MRRSSSSSLIRNLQAHKVISSTELTAALWQLVELLGTLQAEHTEAIRNDLLRVLMSREVSLTPPATLIQAQRLAAHRDALLATPVLHARNAERAARECEPVKHANLARSTKGGARPVHRQLQGQDGDPSVSIR